MNLTGQLNSTAPKYLDIVVDRSTEMGYTNTDTGAKFVGYAFGFYDNGALLETGLEFYQKNLFFDPNDYSFVRILIYNKYSTNSVPSIIFNMKPKNSRRFLDYLYVGNEALCELNEECNSIRCTQSRFDCCSFVYYILNIPCCSKHNISPIKESQATPGTIVYMNSKKSNNFHYGLYLGDGVYLSKFGNLGPFMFNDFKNLSKAFNVDTLNTIQFIGCI